MSMSSEHQSIWITAYSACLHDARAERDALRDELNIVVKQLLETQELLAIYQDLAANEVVNNAKKTVTTEQNAKTDYVLERLNDWHIDIVRHNVDWGRLVIDAIDNIEHLQQQLEVYKDLYAGAAVEAAEHKMRWYPG